MLHCFDVCSIGMNARIKIQQDLGHEPLIELIEGELWGSRAEARLVN